MHYPTFCLEQKSLQFIHDAASKSPKVLSPEFNFLLHMCSSSLDACLSFNVATHRVEMSIKVLGVRMHIEIMNVCGRTQLFSGCCQRKYDHVCDQDHQRKQKVSVLEQNCRAWTVASFDSKLYSSICKPE
jgi:hypothetical protein